MNADPYDYENAPALRRRSPLRSVSLFAALLLLIAAVVHFGDRTRRSTPAADPRPVQPRGSLASDEQTTIELFERTSPSVVYIRPLAVVRRSLFDTAGTLVEAGTGSGFIWDRDGHIVTNFHVIQGADGAHVTLPDNTTYDAALVGAWPSKDIAVLRIDAPPDKLVPLSIGTSKGLRVGQKVFAIGNPYGLDFTLTTGIVSALDRQIEAVNGRTIHGVIQTDAAINPGNSGGPLLDSAGRLIGINTSIVSRTGASAGIGFAVPVDTINRVVPQLIAHGKVIRPGLGVYIADDSISRRLRLGGVLIKTVTSGGAADQAGLRSTVLSRDGRIVLGDIITKIDDTPTPDADALFTVLEKYEVGQTVRVTLVRNDKPMTVPVVLQAVE